MQITITLNVPDRLVALISESSIERVINNSMHRAERAADDDAGVNYDDWRDWKWPTVSLFNAVRDAIFRHKTGTDHHPPYELQGPE